MNPEFVRNLWLEATPFRLALIAGILLLAFAAAGTLTGFGSSHGVAMALYWFFVVLWGTRSAGLSVVGEIRERTWDSQKLSAIGPVEMVWGKLFGATVHNWFGGLICLPFILAPLWREGPAAVLTYGAVLLMLGVFAQSVALLSSLVLIHRQTGNWRLDTFLCQVAGILMALAFYSAWSSPDAFLRSNDIGFTWWGHLFGLGNFQLFALLLFTAWALIGCWRAMRAELRFANGPFVWLGWLVFISLFDAGFWNLIESKVGERLAVHGAVLPMALAWIALLTSGYGMAFLEPKDPVRLRWLGEQVHAGRIGRAFLALDAWMLSYGVAVAFGLVLAALLLMQGSALGLSVIAMVGFFTRDIAIFVAMRMLAGGKGDFAAVAVLAALYLLLPMILHGSPATALFLPLTDGPLLSVLSGWIQGVAAAGLAAHRVLRPR